MKNPKLKDHWVRRGIAFIFDILVILGIFFISVMILIFIIISVNWQPEGNFNANGIVIVGAGVWLLVVFSFITIVFSMLYFLGMEVKFGGTIGKKFMSLRVLPTEGPMDITKGILRNLAKLGGIFIGCMLGNFVFVFGGVIGLLIIDTFFGISDSFDPRQKYTDNMANTTVVRKDIEENLEDLKVIPTVTVKPKTEKIIQTTSEVAISGSTIESPKTDRPIIIKDGMVEKYSNFFGISEARAEDLYDAGYRQFKDFKDAIVEDLMMVNDINPTVARVIINKVSSEPLPED